MLLALDDHYNGEQSKRSLKFQKQHRKKAKATARSKKKYDTADQTADIDTVNGDVSDPTRKDE